MCELTKAIGEIKTMVSDVDEMFTKLGFPTYTDLQAQLDAAKAEIDEQGCTCQRCKRNYRVDFIISDELWEQIRNGSNLLCGPCITSLVEGRGEFDAFNIQQIEQARADDGQI